MNKHDLMNFIRRDGQADAPVFFLTIEDGGTIGSESEFLAGLNSDGVWAPKFRTECELGTPGRFLPKIMLSLIQGEFSKWREYRDTQLYLANECNVKFFPIGRPRTSFWEEYYTLHSGLTAAEYRNECKAVRPNIIWERYGGFISNCSLIIVLGALEEWHPILEQGLQHNIVKTEVERDIRGKVKWGFYYDGAGKLVYTYFSMFRRGVSDADITHYGQKLRKLAPLELFDRIKL